MTSCLVLFSPDPMSSSWLSDLEDAGIHVLGAVQRSNLVQEVARMGPDLLVVHEPVVDEGLCEALALLRSAAPRPVLLFTGDAEVENMARALDAGVQELVVNGYAPARLRALIHLAQLRFARDERDRAQLAAVSHRFEERKLVDRAKGILMRARQVSEDEAFHVLRAASMHSNRRVGQVSQHVIAAAGSADAINRAGQLRMLSQRALKLHALAAMSIRSTPVAEVGGRVDATLAALDKRLSKATYGDLLDAVTEPWSRLKPLLGQPADAPRLEQADALAERMLTRADRLVMALESAGATGTLHIINLAGRQRMLSQRIAKQALLSALLRGEARDRAAAGLQRDRLAFEQALDCLNGAPLTTPEIRQSLAEAGSAWQRMSAALADQGGGPRALADTSEALLALFEQLTQRYEHSMQVLMA
jgi:AmiR/NasT family two-component response regulator